MTKVQKNPRIENKYIPGVEGKLNTSKDNEVPDKEFLVQISSDATMSINLLNNHTEARCVEIAQSEWTKKGTFLPDKIYFIEIDDNLRVFRRIVENDDTEITTASDNKEDPFNNCGVYHYLIKRIFLVNRLTGDVYSPTIEDITEESLSCTPSLLIALCKYDDNYSRKLYQILFDFLNHKSYEKLMSDYDAAEPEDKTPFHQRWDFATRASLLEVTAPSF